MQCSPPSFVRPLTKPEATRARATAPTDTAMICVLGLTSGWSPELPARYCLGCTIQVTVSIRATVASLALHAWQRDAICYLKGWTQGSSQAWQRARPCFQTALMQGALHCETKRKQNAAARLGPLHLQVKAKKRAQCRFLPSLIGNTEHIACRTKLSTRSCSRTDWAQPHCKAASCSRTTKRVQSGTPRRQTRLSGLQSPPPGTHGPAHERGGSGPGHMSDTEVQPETGHRRGQAQTQRQHKTPEHFGDLKGARAQLLTAVVAGAD